MPEVSIIVPIYNVAPYLQKCINSLINQSLKDIEIILVDDGSTDGGDEICDRNAVRDNRIRVLHKVNEGLSCARNSGIDISRAAYLMFVDGDDYVAPSFCEEPLKAAIGNNADLVMFQTCNIINGRKKYPKSNEDAPFGTVDAITAITNDKCASWNKLYGTVKSSSQLWTPLTMSRCLVAQ